MTDEEYCRANDNHLDCPAVDKVILYADPNYGGQSLHFDIGLYNTPKLEADGFKGVMSSIKIPKNVEVVLHTVGLDSGDNQVKRTIPGPISVTEIS